MVILGAGSNHMVPHGHELSRHASIMLVIVRLRSINLAGAGRIMSARRSCDPQTGWTPLAVRPGLGRPPRQMNSTSAFYAHTDQWRYETLDVEGNSVTDGAASIRGTAHSIDYNVRAERMGWLPSAPQLETNPLEVSKPAGLPLGWSRRTTSLNPPVGCIWKLSCEDPDAPEELATQHVRLALEPAGAFGQGA